MRVAIMQPTYLPWCGHFDLIDRVDLFIFLDDVAFQKRSWQQRNRIVGRSGLEWLTLPVKVRGRGGQRISDVELVDSSALWRHSKTISSRYGRVSLLAAVVERLESFARDHCSSLCDLNISLIKLLCGCLDIRTPFALASQLNVGGVRGEHLARLCEATNARTYVTPPGSVDYLLEDRVAFEERGIPVLVQAYEHPVYSQAGSSFVSHASVIDLLANTGKRAPSVMRSGRRPSEALVRQN